jgi:hypothetical protein
MREIFDVGDNKIDNRTLLATIIMEHGYSEDPSASYCICYNPVKGTLSATDWGEDSCPLGSICVFKVTAFMFHPQLLSAYIPLEEFITDGVLDYESLLSEYLNDTDILDKILQEVKNKTKEKYREVDR